MDEWKQSGARRWLLTGVAAVALCVSGPAAFAQDAEDVADEAAEEERVTVTGSRITRDDFSSENPVTIISGDDILNSGFGNLGEVLRNDVAVGSGGFNQSSNLSGGGATSIDLRNLGPDRVLVLINGKRVASFADSLANRATDLSLIPTVMVERVEILRDGASAAYGADAVSGVVNVILKDNFEGLELSAFAGISGEGDAEQWQISSVLGGNFDGGRGNVVMGMEYRFQDNVPQRDRDWAIPSISTLQDTGDPNNPGTFIQNGSLFSPGGLFLGDISGPAFCTIPKVFGGDEITNDLANCPSLSAPTSRNDLARYDYALEQDILNGNQLFNATVYGTYDISDWMTFVLEGQFSNRESTSYLDGSPGSFGTATIPNGWRVPATNPNNPTGEDGTFLIRPSSTVGTRQQFIETDLFRVVPGIKADLSHFGMDNWAFEFSYLWTKVNSQLEQKGIWNLQRANIISDPVRCAADEICSGIVNPSGALDTFRPGNWTDAEISYLRQEPRTQSVYETNQFFALLTGEAFDMPAGPVGFAVGYEYRDEYGKTLPDSVTESGESNTNQNFSTEGSFDTHEVFGEFNLPILKDAFLAEELSLNLQGRWVDYSNFGTAEVWKIGVNYQMFEDLRFRLNRGTSFRAPTITNLFGGGTVSADFVTDPCQQYGQLDPAQGDNANIIANCAAEGLAPNFQQPVGQYSTLSGSNPNLEPETADTLSVGVIFTPRWVPGLSLAIDYWDIEVENLISRNTTDSLIDGCYASAPVLSDPFCTTFTRNLITGAPIGLVNQLSNQDTVLETDGVDWAVSYGFDLADLGFLGDTGAALFLDWRGTMVFENTFFPGAGGADGRGSIVDVRQVGEAELAFGDWSFTWRTRYIDDLEDPQFTGANAFNYDGTDNHWEHDIRVSYLLNNLNFTFGVNNLFDEEPPYIQELGNNTDTFTFGTAVIGRYAFGRVTANF